MKPYILVIDQSTLASFAFVFDAEQNIVGMGKMELTQHYPQPGWVEQVAEEIWATCLWACKTALRKAGITAGDLAGIGITNQRATTLIWDRATGRAIHNAVIWRDQRTASHCTALKDAGHEPMLAQRTGLLIHPYFSASKVKWLLDNVEGARDRAAKGELAFGSVDSFLIYRLTGGRAHATDATNASQTILFDIEANIWDPELLDLFDVPANILPRVLDSADDFGLTDPGVLGAAVPILGVVGNQQAALIGQACFAPGMLKSTYDEHCFVLLNTGGDIVRSTHRLLSTIAYRLDGKSTYALEGAIVSVGGSLQWLHDDLEIFDHWDQAEKLASASDPSLPIYLVPAFVGAGSDWRETDARGALFGLSRGARPHDLVRAALEAVGYQSHDLIETMRKDWGHAGEIVIRADGNMIASDWTLQFLADITEATVDRAPLADMTPLGVAWLAGWKAGVWPDAAGFAARRASDREFHPRMEPELRRKKLDGWRDAVRRTLPEATD
ncbi:MAG: glpK [Devosia sp.]|uniref:FGGY family carbohydrate kinase n=1 Tax=Devosia sp. TaxID=1871048 RepID=UPI002611A551|nr:glycerol kinase [Devosia sp.]MDB5587711.1 glpK [Devosia sp.]